MSNKKRLLLLGGSAQQVVAIEKAKELGYYTILCDYLPDNPGQYHADKFYQYSTTDKELMLKVAAEEKIDGIVAYASDPAAPSAAYVAEKLGLPTNPYKSVEILCNKDKFRTFLSANGFNTPLAKGYSDISSAVEDLRNSIFNFPVIVKPVDSSGSKGVTVVRDKSNFQKAAEFALNYSRSRRIVVEEFIEQKHKYLVGGDIFVANGRVILWGLMNCHRDSKVNPLVPVGKSYPLALDAEDEKRVRECLQTMVDKLNITAGAMNVELVIDKENRVWPIDIGPRNGGNMIPDLLGMIFGVDVVEMTVRAAMGEKIDTTIPEGKKFYATHNLHTDKNGIFEKIEFASALERYIIRKNIYKRTGDAVEYFNHAACALGIIFMKFDSMNEMFDTLESIGDGIKVTLKA